MVAVSSRAIHSLCGSRHKSVINQRGSTDYLWGNMKILVTGGAGYKGVKLVGRLLELGHEVTLLDNFLYGYEPILHLSHHTSLSVLEFDIRAVGRKTVAGFDVVYHLAGISGMPACAANPHSAQLINVNATRALVDSMDPGQLLVNASTTSMYGGGGGVCDEQVTVDPVSLYGITKYQAEVIAQGRADSVSLRFATVFGASPRMRVDLLVNDFAYRAVNERVLVLFAAHTKRTFVHIDDAIDAYLFVLDHADKMRGEVYNVGSESLNFSKLEIAHAIKKFVPVEIVDSSVADRDVRDFIVSFAKIRALGFETSRSLDTGIQELLRLYAYYKPHSNYRVI